MLLVTCVRVLEMLALVVRLLHEVADDVAVGGRPANSFVAVFFLRLERSNSLVDKRDVCL